MKTFGYKFLTLQLILCFFLTFAPNKTNAEEVPLNLQAAIFFRVLSYDNSIKNKAGKLTISIVIDKKTTGKKAQLLKGFNALKGKTIFNKVININVIEVSSPDQLANQINSRKSDILYVADGADKGIINKLVSIATKTKKTTIGGSEQLAKMGFAIGLAIENGKPKIIVNLKAALAQGMQLSSKVLRLAKVLK